MVESRIVIPVVVGSSPIGHPTFFHGGRARAQVPPCARRAARGRRVCCPFASRTRRRRVDSVYYDTPDLRLEAPRAALRVRRDGRQWLQAFKAPQGAQSALAERARMGNAGAARQARHIAFPARGGACRERPRSGTACAHAATGVRDAIRAPLGPAAPRTRTCAPKHASTAAAIEAGGAREPILELELELIEGKLGAAAAPRRVAGRAARARDRDGEQGRARLSPLIARRRRAPAKWPRPPIAENAAASDAFATLCAAALAQIAGQRSRRRRGRDPEYLHQLRVGMPPAALGAARLPAAAHAPARGQRRAAVQAR